MNDVAPALPATTTRSTVLTPTTYGEALQFAEMMSKSSMVPGEYRGKPENILLAVQLGAELGMPPLQAVQSIATINGKPCVYGDAALALVRGSPVCEDVIETFEGSGDNLTAICEARRKGKSPVRSQFSIADAKRAGLWGKQGPWTSYPRRMLQMRARGFALRDAFPDVLRGVITREEAEDYPVDVSQPREPIDITPKHDLDQFAATPRGDDPAMAAARQGTEAFREYWRTLTPDERAMLKSDIAVYQNAAMDADAAAAAARDSEDPFGLPPIEPASSHDATERPGPEDAHSQAAQPAPSAGQGEPSQPDMLGDGENLTVPLPRNPGPADLDYYARQLLALATERPADKGHAARVRRANENGIHRLKEARHAEYDAIMAALAG